MIDLATVAMFGALMFGFYSLLVIPTQLFNMLFDRARVRGPIPGTNEEYPDWVRNRHRKTFDLLAYNYRIPLDRIKREDCE